VFVLLYNGRIRPTGGLLCSRAFPLWVQYCTSKQTQLASTPLASGSGGSLVRPGWTPPPPPSFQLCLDQPRIRCNGDAAHTYLLHPQAPPPVHARMAFFLMKTLFARALRRAWVLDADFCHNCEACFASILSSDKHSNLVSGFPIHAQAGSPAILVHFSHWSSLDAGVCLSTPNQACL
jgi:hypothetical protein